MSLFELRLSGLAREPAHVAADMLGEFIEPAADALSIFEDGPTWLVQAYYRDEVAAGLAGRRLAEQLPDLATSLTITAVPDENWVARSQAALPPVHAGRFTVCGSHDFHRIARGPNTLVIEAGEAFGTAHHATTFGCLVAIDHLTRKRCFKRILDLGTGSGILAIALARVLPQSEILAGDIDARSIEVAKANALANRLAGWGRKLDFRVCEGAADATVCQRAPYDLVVANILAGPLLQMGPAVSSLVAGGGLLVLSGILVPQAAQIIARYTSLGFAVKQHARHHGWSTITFYKR